MSPRKLLAVELARQCADKIRARGAPMYTDSTKHLLKMCSEIEKRAENWPSTKMHRWIGFIQGTMVAMEITTIEEESDTVRKAKTMFSEDDNGLIDHNNPDHHFEFEIGGES